jgi:hypothetical protein
LAVIVPCICRGRSGGKGDGEFVEVQAGNVEVYLHLLVGHGKAAATAEFRLRQAHLQALQVKALSCQVRLEEEIRAGQSEPFGLQTQCLQGAFEAVRAPASTSSHDDIPHFEGLRGPLPGWHLPLQCWDT